MRLLLLSVPVLLFGGCGVDHDPYHWQDRDKDIILYDQNTNGPVADIHLHQHYRHDDLGDHDSAITLDVTNVSGKIVTFNFGIDASEPGYHITYDGGVVNLGVGANKGFGQISDSCLNIDAAQVEITTPTAIVYSSNG